MRVQLTKHVHAPLEAVYAWSTDYRADDSDLTAVHLAGRRVLRREGDVVEMEDVLILGRPVAVRYVVRLHPPDRWEADGQSRMGSVRNEYRLTSEPGTTRLDITFDMRPRGVYRVLAPFARPALRRRLSRLWDDFVHAMETAR